MLVWCKFSSRKASTLRYIRNEGDRKSIEDLGRHQLGLALEKFQEQHHDPVDFRKYASLLRQCGIAKALPEGRHVHAHIAKSGLVHHTFLGNHLVQMYGKCGNVEDAWLVFQQIFKHNVFSWNIMLTAYAQNGKLQDAGELFSRMPQQDVVSWNEMVAAFSQNGHSEEARNLFEAMPERDLVSWNTMIAAYAQMGQMLDARIIFDDMPDKNTVSWNLMIAGYAQRGQLEDARCMFEQLSVKELVSWNSVIAAYAQNGCPKEALVLFCLMDCHGVHPDEVTYVSALDACGALTAETPGRLIHADIVLNINDAGSNVVVGTALLSMYGKCGLLADAISIFSQMPGKNVVSWNAMITAYAFNGELEEARKTFDTAPRKDTASWNAMITAYAHGGHIVDAKSLFDVSERDVVGWNAMITAYSQTGNGEYAIELFKAMDVEGVHPNKITFVIVLDACDTFSWLHQGEVIHAEINEKGLELDTMLSTALLIMYGKCGSLKRAGDIFETMSVRSSIAWNAMVAAHCQNGQWMDAVELFQGLNLEGMCPDELVFVSLLFACSHVGMLKDGWKNFASMQVDYGIVPGANHYLSMIDVLGRAGELEDAEELISSMPFYCDELAWTMLLSACRSHDDEERGRRAAKHVLDMDPDCGAPYVLLSSICTAAGIRLSW